MRKNHTVVWLASMLVASAAAGGPNKNYKPHHIDNIHTYKGKGNEGQTLFSLKVIDREKPSGLITELRVKAGEAPEQLALRGYFPATLKEVQQSLGHPSRNLKLICELKIDDGESITLGEDPVEGEQWSWAAMALELPKDGPTLKAIAASKPGKHSVSVMFRLDFEEQVVDEDTHQKKWDDNTVYLASGSLDVIVE